MNRPVRWAREALDDLKRQIVYTARENPDAAKHVADQIRASCDALGHMATGRPGRVTGTYEKSVSRLPYVIAYEVRTIAGRESLNIIRVIHTARDWPEDGWPAP